MSRRCDSTRACSLPSIVLLLLLLLPLPLLAGVVDASAPHGHDDIDLTRLFGEDGYNLPFGEREVSHMKVT